MMERCPLRNGDGRRVIVAPCCKAKQRKSKDGIVNGKRRSKRERRKRIRKSKVKKE